MSDKNYDSCDGDDDEHDNEYESPYCGIIINTCSAYTGIVISDEGKKELEARGVKYLDEGGNVIRTCEGLIELVEENKIQMGVKNYSSFWIEYVLKKYLEEPVFWKIGTVTLCRCCNGSEIEKLVIDHQKYLVWKYLIFFTMISNVLSNNISSDEKIEQLSHLYKSKMTNISNKIHGKRDFLVRYIRYRKVFKIINAKKCADKKVNEFKKIFDKKIKDSRYFINCL